MKDKKQLIEEVEKTLQAFDDDVPLEGNPFLATRIQAERDRRRQLRPAGFRLHISLNQAVILCVLLINIVTVIHYLDWNRNQTLHDKLVLALIEDVQIVQSQDPF
jgi:hypothetical protein